MRATITNTATYRRLLASCTLFAFSLLVSDGHPTSGSSETASVSFEQGVLGLFESSPFDQAVPTDYSTSPGAFVPRPIFFPPNPPPLGAVPSWPVGVRFEMGAPRLLSAFVGEPFYAALSPRLALKRCSPHLKASLETYYERRGLLRNELAGVIRSLDGAEPKVRRDVIASFAREQTPRIAKLEKDAEGLRRKLASHGLFLDESGNWNNLREWKLGRGSLKHARAENPIFEYMVLRAAAHFEEGFSPGQRRLIREAAMEMEDEMASARGEPTAGKVLTFFSPDTARVLLPATLPGEVAQSLSEYDSEKSALKAELRDLIYSVDGAFLKSSRNRAFRELAASQAPRIKHLETLAERIRLGLAGLPELHRAAPPADPSTEVARPRPANELTLEMGNDQMEEANFEYDIAVFEPGLSPEQRRLLFSAAIEKMQLPLPGAELQPTLIPGTLVSR